MSHRIVPRFKYDSMSIKYLGVKAIGRGPLSMKEFRVVVEQPMQEVRSITTPPNERGKEVAGKTSISGRVIFEYERMTRDEREHEQLLESPVWDVTLHAYSPIDDVAYEARVTGIQLVSMQVTPMGPGHDFCAGVVCDFIAAGIIPWKKA